ncbi:hypothetical protein L1887_05016 [Cichorium endivia]|nr:hypothetical protein L1887_05016 [Cichorium endivia]
MEGAFWVACFEVHHNFDLTPDPPLTKSFKFVAALNDERTKVDTFIRPDPAATAAAPSDNRASRLHDSLSSRISQTSNQSFGGDYGIGSSSGDDRQA